MNQALKASFDHGRFARVLGASFENLLTSTDFKNNERFASANKKTGKNIGLPVPMKRNFLLYKNVLTYDTVQVILRSKALFIQQQHIMQIIMTSLVDKTRDVT